MASAFTWNDCGVYPHGYELTPNQFLDWEQLISPFCGGDLEHNWRLFQCASAERWSFRYTYNQMGTDFRSDTERPNLGLDGDIFVPNRNASTEAQERANRALPESRVRVPDDMIAAGPFLPFSNIQGFGWPGVYVPRISRFRLHSLDIALFCDGHVESSNPDLIPTRPWPLYGPEARMFKPDAARAKR